MVKLATVRKGRLYGPGAHRDWLESVNAFLYLAAAILLLAGLVLQLPAYSGKLGLIFLLVSMLVIFLVNLHDLYAHVAAVNYRSDLMMLDIQLIMVEILAPIVQSIGSLLILVGVVFLMLTSGGRYSRQSKEALVIHGSRLFIAGPALWLLGSIHNSFQVFERAGLQAQAMQRSVTMPFLIGSTLLLVGGVLGLNTWPTVAAHRAQRTATWFAIWGAGVILLGAIMNAVKVMQLQGLERQGYPLEPLRGGAEEKLWREREGREPFIEGVAKHRADTSYIEGGVKEPVFTSAERLY